MKIKSASIISLFSFLLPLISTNAWADYLSQDSAGSIRANIPGYAITVAQGGNVEFSGKHYNCNSSSDKSYILGTAVLNCSSKQINLATPSGSFNYSPLSGQANLALTNGHSESRVFQNDGAEKSIAEIDSDIEIEDQDSKTEVTAGNAHVKVETRADGHQEVVVNNPGAAAQAGMNTLGNVLGGLVQGTSGDTKAANDTAKGLGVVGGMLGGMVNGANKAIGSQKGLNITVNGADGSEVIIKNGKIAGSSNGNSWRISSDTENFNTEEVMQELKVKQDNNEMHFDMADEVLFDFNSAAIKPAASKTLQKIAFLIKQKSAGKVSLEGHTDSIGSDETNLELSKKRVASVMTWLIEAEGIPAEILNGKGFGESKPVAYNTLPDGSDNPEGRAKNRRVSFRFAAQ